MEVLHTFIVEEMKNLFVLKKRDMMTLPLNRDCWQYDKKWAPDGNNIDISFCVVAATVLAAMSSSICNCLTTLA